MSAEAPAQEKAARWTRDQRGEGTATGRKTDRYPGTRQRENRGNERGKFRRGGRSASFFYVCVSRSPPPVLEVMGDLDTEDPRVGGRGKTLGRGLRDGAAGSTSDRARRGFFASLSPPTFGKTEVTRELD